MTATPTSLSIRTCLTSSSVGATTDTMTMVMTMAHSSPSGASPLRIKVAKTMITIHERVSAWRSRLVRRSSPFDDYWTLLPGVNSRSAGAMVTKPACSSSLGDEPAGSSSLGNPFRWCESNSRA